MGRRKNIYSRSDPKLTLILILSLTQGLGLRLTPRKRIGVGNQKPTAKDWYPRRRSGKNLLNLGRRKNIYSESDPKLILTLTLRLTLGLGLELTPGKMIRVENLIPNEKDGFGRSRAGKSLLNLCRYKIFYPGGDPKLTLTLTLSVTLGLGLELTPGETIRVESLIPNEKDGFGRSRAGKSLLNLCRYKIFYPGRDLKLTLTLTLSVTLGLGLGFNPKLNPRVRVGVNS